MRSSHAAWSHRFVLLLVLGATMTTSACLDDDTVAVGDTAEVTVMTRNLYIGGDIFRLTTALPQEIPLVVAQLFATVQVNDFEARAGALAAEIEADAPDLIGLQEVSLFRIQDPGDYLTGNTTPNAETVYIDYLEVLLDSLAARGLDYTVAAQVENADVELPAARSPTEFFDVRLTDRDVILARGGVQTANAGAATFTTLAPLPVAGQTIDFPRGYTWVSAAVDGVEFLFVNTHLEVSAGGQLTVVQAAQAYELTGAFGSSSPLIMVGDFNTEPGEAPYGILTASFADMWTGGDGLTCCQPEVLLQSADLSQRIDLVLARGAI
ncbi:MAG: endonuclease, partial [Gemmatimonadota bacterium]